MASIFETVLNKEEAFARMQGQFLDEKREILKSWMDFLEKGRRAQIGEIREWKGGKYRKTELGWVPAIQKYRTSRKEKDSTEQFAWKGSLVGPEDFGSPQCEKDLNISLSTETQYKTVDLGLDKYGNQKWGWTEDRIEKVHKPIIESFVKRGTKNPNGVKTCTLMMGAPASGKGFLQEFLRNKGVMDKSLVAIDPDDIKVHALAPDYDRYSEANARKGASFVHEEGSDIAKSTFRAMEEKGFDYLQDKVFSDYKKLIEEIDWLNKAGYKVKIIMASSSAEVAKPRMLQRAKKEGRYVPKKYFEKCHKDIEETWNKLMKNMPEGVISAQKYDMKVEEPSLMEEFKAEQ